MRHLAIDATRREATLVVAAERLPEPLRRELGAKARGGLATIELPRTSHPAPVVALEAEGWRCEIAERRIRLEGATNFRDAGGLTTVDGIVPWRWRYRSENLARLSAKDWDILEALDIRLVLDLRTAEEASAAPTQAPSFIEVRSCPMSAPLAGAEDATTAILNGALRCVRPDDLVRHYAALVEAHAPRLDEVVEVLEEHPSPVLVHCTAGKDRTGIAIALWQLRHGVHYHAAVEDFGLSNLLRTLPRFLELREAIERVGTDPRAVRPYLSAHVPALELALELLGSTRRPWNPKAPSVGLLPARGGGRVQRRAAKP